METIEQPLFEQIPLLRTLIDNIPHPVYCQDIHGFYLGYNRAFHDLFGEGVQESYIGKTIFDLPINIEEAVKWHKADLELFRSPADQVHEITLTFQDGSVRSIIIKKSIFSQADGSPGGIVGVISDAADSKKAEDGLQESEERFKVLSEASLEAIIFMENGIITDLNQRTYEMFGYGDGEIIGLNALDLIAPDMRAVTGEKINSGNGERYETMGLKKDGTVFPISVFPRELDLKGKHVRVSVIRDLTEQKYMEAEVLKSKNIQSVGTLAGGVAHDFNNLLMAIIGNISLAKIHAPKGSKTIDYLKEAERMIFMGKDLTHQLLTFSRSVETFKKITNIGLLIRQTVEKALSGSPIKLNCNIPDDLSPVEVDEDQIKQVIQNVIVNAKEAMQTDGELHITCENVRITPQHKLPPILEDYVRIVIQDEGVGIPEENMSKIFDPYFTTKDMGSQKGVGLGLAICYAIVKKHNGYILVNSTPGKGTTFQIYLPAYKQHVAAKASEKKASRRGRGRILIVDDEEMVLKIGEKLLLHMEYEVTTTTNGEEAIFLYRQAVESGRPYDVVILDLSLESGMDGTEVMEKLTLIQPDVKAIISSEYLHDPVIINYEKYGFAGTLTKPYDPRELDEKLQNIIKRDSRQ